jgi:outer membrane lipoprotein-sorting protein
MLRSLTVAALFLWLAGLTGCLFRSHKVESNVSTAALQTATKEQLVAAVNHYASQIDTLNATVDIDSAVGGVKKGKVTEYKQIRGYVLLRRPEMLRMIGLFPIVRNRAFDMVSDGKQFKLYIPSKNRFIIGSNNVVHPSNQPLENIRPQQIYDALLLHPIESPDEIAVVEYGTEMVADPKSHRNLQQADYELDVVRRGPSGWYLDRKVIFSRIDLRPDRQLVYDPNGQMVTDAAYSDIKDFNGIEYPTTITIWRPIEEYSITLHVVKLVINQPLRDDQFVLAQPPGAQVVYLDQPPQPGNRANAAAPK